jgi:hypothetical protein
VPPIEFVLTSPTLRARLFPLPPEFANSCVQRPLGAMLRLTYIIQLVGPEGNLSPVAAVSSKHGEAFALLATRVGSSDDLIRDRVQDNNFVRRPGGEVSEGLRMVLRPLTTVSQFAPSWGVFSYKT